MKSSPGHVPRFAWAFSLAVAICGGTGCAGPALRTHDVDRPTVLGDVPVPLPEISNGSEANSLTLADALALALRHHPSLAVREAEIRALEATARQAGLRPNPNLELEVEDFGGTGDAAGFDGLETTLSLSQLVELADKRTRRLDVAHFERDLGVWDLELARIDVLTRTAQDYVAVVAAQERLVLAVELVDVAAGVLDAVSRRVRAGATSPVEERRAQVELETSRIDRERRAQELRAVRRRLVSKWTDGAPRFERATAVLRPPGTLRTTKELLAHVETSPTLARWSVEIERRRSVRELERARGRPDFEVGVGLRHFNASDDVAATVGLSLPLQVFDRNRGGVEAAEARRVKAEHERRVLSRRVQASIVEHHARAEAAVDEARALGQRAVPAAEAAFELAREAYQRGRTPLTDVLETERTLFELRTRLVDVTEEAHLAVSELERLLGIPVSGARPTNDTKDR